MKRTLKTKQKYWLGGALKGATSGASTGSTVLPGWGTLAGAVVGGVMGGIGQSQEEKAQQQAANMQQLQHRQVAQMNAMQPQQQYTPTFKDGGSINDLAIKKSVREGNNYRLPNGTLISAAEFNRYKNIPLGHDGNIQGSLKGRMPTDYHPFRSLIPERYFADNINKIAKEYKDPNEAAEAVSTWRSSLHPYYSDAFSTMDHNATKSFIKPGGGLNVELTPRVNEQDPLSVKFSYKYGGRMKKYQQGGQFEEYDGQTHGGPDEGIPIDSTGSPQAQTQEQAVALTEDGEVRWNDYIFSNSTKLPGNKKRTFADEAKRIKNKYKLRLGKDLEKKDPIDSPALEAELNTLMELQETLKGNMIHQEDAQAMMQEQEQAMAVQMQQGQEQQMNPEEAMMQEQAMGQEMPMEQPMMKYGGKLKKYYGGGLKPTHNINITSGPTSLGSDRLNEVPFTGGVSPWAMAPSVIGNIAGMIGEKTRKNIPLNLGRMQAQRANLDRARQDIRGQAAAARGSMGASMRQAGATGSQYMTGSVAGNTAIAGQAGSQLGNITTQEEQMNMQSRAQADAANMQARGQEQMWRAQQEAASQDRLRQYRDSISQGVGQYLSEDARSRQNAELLGMMSDNYMYTQSADFNRWNPFSRRNMRRRMAPTNITQRS